jgi:hypothetical protein
MKIAATTATMAITGAGEFSATSCPDTGMLITTVFEVAFKLRRAQRTLVRGGAPF